MKNIPFGEEAVPFIRPGEFSWCREIFAKYFDKSVLIGKGFLIPKYLCMKSFKG